MSTAFADLTGPHFDAPKNDSLLANSSPPCLLLCDLGSSITADVLSGELETGRCCTKRVAAFGENGRQGNVLFAHRPQGQAEADSDLVRLLLVRCGAGRTTTIDDLPDNVLLDIFDFYRTIPMFPENLHSVWEWHVLAHVCRKWRQVVFASPARLGLRLLCTRMMPVRKMLDIWPPTLPIIVEKPAFLRSQPDEDDEDDNLIAALERRDRVCVIAISRLARHQLERFTAAMQEPFPTLTHLYLRSNREEALGVAPTLPATFMGGSAPRLQSLALEGISFTALPNFVLSPENLTSIELSDIPSTGYVSPEAMVAFLSTLTRLRSLTIQFKFPSPPPDPTSRRAAPPTRVVLPALIYFRFKGISEYLEDMVWNRRPSAQDLRRGVFQSAHFCHPTARPVHPSHRNPQVAQHTSSVVVREAPCPGQDY